MGPGRHIQSLDLVMGAMPGAQWVRNDRLRWSFLARNPHFLGGFSGTFLASNDTKVAVNSGWNGLYGSMGPNGHAKHLDLVMGAMPGAQWVQNDRPRVSFLA